MKRKVSIIIIFLLITLSMTACAKGIKKETVTTTKYQVLLNNKYGFVYTFQDGDTGVWYLSTSDGITPRLNPDGSFYVTEKN